jgi:arylsulfatase A-like enzyme
MQWEGNFRMPTILTFPGTLPAGSQYHSMASTLDFYATAAAAAGVALPGHCEGKDLLPLLLGKAKANPDEALFWNTSGVQAARWKQWRLVRYRKEASWRLYDISSDPAEKTDLSARYPEIVREIDRRYHTWLKQMDRPCPPIKPPKEMLPHTHNGNHARRPFGRGWMSVEDWDRIKHDPALWSEMHIRRKMLRSQHKK